MPCPSASMRSRLYLLPLILLMAGLSLFPALAQSEVAGEQPEPEQPTQEEPAEPFRVTVALALVQASVRDRDGNFVKGLKEKDFQLLENGVLQELVLFSEEPEAPIRVAFLLDLSGSMVFQNHLAMARSGIRYFLDRLGPKDEAALLGFADGEVEVLAGFTSDKRVLSDALLSRDAYGQTALLDAVARAPDMVPRQGNARRAIVLFSDGVDNISRLAPGEAVSIARRTEVPVYSVGFLDEVERRRAEVGGEALRRFSSETGGQVFLADDPHSVNQASRTVVDELKNTYVLGYYPSVAGQTHSLEVVVTCQGCVVTSRRGLYATSAEAASGD
jgi:Ca-activated chloride channel family protein